MRMQLPWSSFFPDEAGLLHHDDLNSRPLDECSEWHSDSDSHSNEGSEWIEGNPETNDEENCRFQLDRSVYYYDDDEVVEIPHEHSCPDDDNMQSKDKNEIS